MRISGTTSDTMPRSGRIWLALSLAAACTATASEVQWTLEEEEDRIALYTRPVADSPFPAVKVVATIDAPFEKVAHALGDGNGCDEWREMCKSSEVLSTVSDTERYVYLVLDLPWPMSDRDMVVHTTAHIDPDARTVNVQLKSASSKHPVQEYVRAQSNGEYQLKATGDAQVEFTYILHTDIGGDVSPDTVNPRLLSSTFEDVKRLQMLAEK